MEEQREQRRVVLRLPAVEEASQRWEETFGRDDFNELERFGVEDVELRVGVTASFAEFHYVFRMDGQGSGSRWRGRSGRYPTSRRRLI